MFAPARLVGMHDRLVRLGVLYPSSGTRDGEFWRFAPAGTSIHVTRLSFDSVGTRQSVMAMSSNEQLAAASSLVAAVEPAAVAWMDTSGSFLFGPDGDEQQVTLIAEIAGAPATTTSTAIIAACRALGITSVDIASPYISEINESLVAFMEAHGVHVGQLRALELIDSYMIASVPESEQLDLIRSAAGTSDAVLVPCTDFLTSQLIPELEGQLKRPVLGAIPVTMWHLTQLVGGYRTKPPESWGRLFSTVAAPETGASDLPSEDAAS